MQTDRTRINSRKIVYLTLHELSSLLQNRSTYKPTHKNTNFDYICFVARAMKQNGAVTFSDQTDIFHYQLKRHQNNITATAGSYYECLCQLKSMDTSFTIQIINMNQVDGNFITTHMIRVIKQDIESRIADNSHAKQNVQILVNQNKQEEVYGKVKKWMIQKSQFTQEEAENQFCSNKSNEILFKKILSKLEDEGLIGNMGDYYQYID